MLRTTSRRHLLLAATVLAALGSSCATVAGTVASPLTGGVDAIVQGYDDDEMFMAPLLFLGGTLGAPFVAFYNGINYDAAGLGKGALYWDDFDQVFRPYEMLSKGNLAR
ncbi:MAG: hypothetical protein P1V81_09795 [Planctomycetota bacterium]|nr:hypothetical protein [Planctomycetota bacterium]